MKALFLLFLAVFLLTAPTATRAGGGLTSSSGDLPLGAGDHSAMWIKPDGSVLIRETDIGTKAKLDVDGSVRVGVDPGFKEKGEGGPCETVGVLSYDGLVPGSFYVCGKGNIWIKLPSRSVGG